jgi:hypothetical protein
MLPRLLLPRLLACAAAAASASASASSASAASAAAPQLRRARALQAAPPPAPPAGSLPLVLGGAPATGTLNGSGASQAYFLDVPTPFSSLHIVLAPQYGETSLYVSLAASLASAPPVAGLAQYSAAFSIGTDIVDVSVSDAAVQQACGRLSRLSGCRFIVNAVGVTVGAGFVISATVDGRPKALAAGVTLEDKGVPGIYNTYSFPSTAAAGPMTFSLTTFAGAPGLFVGCSLSLQNWPRGDQPGSFCKSDAPRADGTGSLVGAGTVTLSQAADGSCACVGGTLFIGVGSSDSSVPYFGLTVTDSAQPAVLLHDGLGVRATSPALPATAPLAPPLPTTALLFDFMFVPFSAGQAMAGTSYGLLAPNPVALAIVSVSQFASSYSGAGARVFAKLVTSAADTPAAGNAHFSTRVVAGAASIAIVPADANLAAACGGPNSTSPCRLRISVVADPGSVMLVAARTNTGLQLTDGVALVAEAAQGAISFFRYTHTQALSPVVVAVTPLTGPVAIYLGNSRNAATVPPTPGAGLSTRSVVPPSASVSSTVLTFSIMPTDADACYAPCTFFIGVAPQSASDGVTSFSILVRTRAATFVPLMDGMPTTDVIAAGEHNFYLATIPQSAQSLTLALVPQSGRVFAKASVNGSVPGDQLASGGAGAMYTGAWARVAGQEVRLTISRADAIMQGFCRSALPPASGGGVGLAFVAAPCPVSIAIYSDVGAAYTLVAYSRSRMLQDGVATTVTQLPGGSLAFFGFQAAAGASHVKLTVTPLVGTPEAFVSLAEQYPGPATSFQYSFAGVASNTISLDVANAQCDRSQSRCIYFISVTSLAGGSGNVGPVSFRIQGTSMKVTYVGIDEPVVGHAGPSVGGMAYYAFTAPAEGLGLDVNIEPSTGGWISAAVGGDFNAQTNSVFPPTIECGAPVAAGGSCPTALTSFVHAQFSSMGGAIRTRVAMTAGAPGYVPGGQYVVGLSSAFESDFVLSVRPAGAAMSLLSGVLIHDSFADRLRPSYAYLVVLPTAPAPMAEVTFQVIPTEGDVVVYLGVNNAAPSAARNDGMAMLAQGYRFTLLPAKLLELCTASAAAGQAPGGDASQCAIYALVVPAARTTYPTNFAIVALLGTDGSDPIRLTPGVPQLGAVTLGAYAYFFAPVSVPDGSSYYVSLVAASDGGASVFVNLQKDQSQQTWSFPQSTSYQLTSAGFIAPTIVTVSPRGRNAAFYSNNTNALIAVYGSSGVFSQFYVTFGTSQSVIELPDGSAIESSADAGTSAYYSFSVGSVPADLSLSITTLSGAVTAFASVWYTPDTVGVNQALRPARGTATWQSNFEGTLFIPRFPTDPRACPGVCNYIFALACESTITCQFQVTATSNGAVLTRLTASVPAVALLPQGAYKYFVFDSGRGNKNLSFAVQEMDGGESGLYITDLFEPGVSGADALPTAPLPCPAGSAPDCEPVANARFASAPGGPPTFVLINQIDFNPDGSPVAPAFGASSTTRSDHLYVIGVYAVTGPLQFSIVGRQLGATTVLTPGGTSANNVGLFQQVDFYSFDNQDMMNDLVVIAELLYGTVEIFVGTRGTVLQCTTSGSGSTARASCAGAVWRATTEIGQATLRVSWRYPCGDERTLAGPCDPEADWQPGPISIAVVTTRASFYSVVADTGDSPVRLVDGQPSEVLQPSELAPQVYTFSTLPDTSGSDVRFEFAARDNSAAFTWFLNSCIDFQCSIADTQPGAVPRTAELSGYVTRSARVEVTVNKGSPAYCLGVPARGDICEYFLTVLPDAEWCANQRFSPCTVWVDLTPIALAGTAPQLVSFSAIDSRTRSFIGLNRPEKLSYFRFFINEPQAPDDSVKDVVVRLDACDSMRGMAVAYLCVSNPLALGNPNGRTLCAMPRRPSVGDNNYALSTLATGFDTLVNLGEPSNELLVGVGVRAPAGAAPASDAAVALYGPSNFEISIWDGDCVRIQLPLQQAGADFAQKGSSKGGSLSWAPPIVSISAQPGGVNITCVGCLYNVYLAPNSFSGFASQTLNASISDLGIIPTTPCGMERWARLVAPGAYARQADGSIAPQGSSAAAEAAAAYAAAGGLITSYQTARDTPRVELLNLSYAVTYKVVVVAVCDEPCVLASYARLGLTPPTGSGFGRQRLPYQQAVFTLKAPAPHLAPLDLTMSPGFFGFLSFVLVVGLGYAIFTAFAASISGGGGSGGGGGDVRRGTLEEGSGVKLRAPDGRVITVRPTSHLFSARALHAEGAEVASEAAGSRAAGAASGRKVVGVVADAQREELDELARISARIFSPARGAGAAATATAGSQYPTPAGGAGALASPAVVRFAASPAEEAQALAQARAQEEAARKDDDAFGPAV